MPCQVCRVVPGLYVPTLGARARARECLRVKLAQVGTLLQKRRYSAIF